MREKTVLAVCAVLLLAAGPAAGQVVVWHDPWLNWDFENLTGQTVNDFAIIVDTPNWNPTEVLTHMPFPQFSTVGGDFDGDGDQDTLCKWAGADVLPNEIAHGGMYMLGSGMVLDAYWTNDGVQVGGSTAITYEQTRIIWPLGKALQDVVVQMRLNIAPGFFESHPGAEAGWVNLRTFVNIPAGELGLEDLNRDLYLDNLAQYEVDPINVETGLPIGPDETILVNDPDSFFDVSLGTIPAGLASPGYEALLHAEVLAYDGKQFGVIGEFWNLNPQSPEPGTMALLAMGALALIRCRRRR